MNDPSFVDTLAGGIRDISALLPLLGTEQCEVHIGSALTKGYLYAAATPISIFGSLGMARAGFKTLVAAISSRRFIGARALINMGFKPQGMNLSLIMRDQDANSHYLVESRLDAMLKDLHIDDARKVKPYMKCAKWNFKMILITAICCVSSIVPYIHLSLGADRTVIVSRLRFPIIRAVGGFLVATMVQLIIQNRILVIVTQTLASKAVSADLKKLGMRLPEGWKDSGLEYQIRNLEWYIEQHREWYSKHIRYPSGDQLKQSIGPDQPDRWNVFVNWCNSRRRGLDIKKGKRKPTRLLRDSSLEEFQLLTAHSALEGTGNSKPVNVNTKWNEWYKELTEMKDGLSKAQKVGLNHFWTIVSFTLLLVGILASVTGYVGCFSVVQGSKMLKGPVIWLVLEATLSVIRFILWGWNPDGDILPPFMLDFELSFPPLLPTCKKSAEEINEGKILPLVRAQEFLESVTAYAGRVERFEDPNLALYYAVTREESSKKRVLYIAIFDPVERTARIYIQPTRNKDVFYSTAGPLEMDPEHDILQIRMGNQIDVNNDPVASNVNTRTLLAKHYRSILDEICSKVDNRRTWAERAVDNIRNPWTFRIEDLKPKKWGNVEHGSDWLSEVELQYMDHGKLERQTRILRQERVKQIDTHMGLVNMDKPINMAEMAWQQKGKDVRKVKKEEEVNPTKAMVRDNEQEEVMLQGESRGLQETVKLDERVISGREMQMCIRGGGDVNLSGDIKTGAEEMKELLMVAERWMMEMILFHEICGWEEKLLEHYKMITSNIVKGKDKSTRERLERMLERQWSSGVRIRLSEDKRAMEVRWKNGLARRFLDQCVKSGYVGNLIDGADWWNTALEFFVRQSGGWIVRDLRWILDDFLCQSNIEDKARKCGGGWIENVVQDWCEEMKCRLRREIEEMEARRDRDEFIVSSLYSKWVNCSSRWLDVSAVHSAGHLNFILKKIKHWRQDILLIEFFSRSDNELAELIPTIHNITSATTVSLRNCWKFGDKACAALVDVITQNKNIVSVFGKEVTVEIKDALQCNIDLLGSGTAISFGSGCIVGRDNLKFSTDLKESRNCFTLRFLAPTKGNLILQLCHDSLFSGTVLKIKEVDVFRHRVPREKNTEYITLLPTIHFTPRKKTELTFVAVCTGVGRWGIKDYNLSDIQLLDEGGSPYNAAQGESRIFFTTSNGPGLIENPDSNGKIVKRVALPPQA